MEKTDNYRIQAAQARQHFLSYDQEALIRKLKLRHDEAYLYTRLFAREYRISRATGNLWRKAEDIWQEADTFAETLTLFDLVCDSREDRHLSFRWKNMASFGLMFHTSLLEGKKDPWAEKFEKDPEGFRRACRALEGRELPQGDIAYAMEIFDGLEVALQLWFGDEEFPANLRCLWDANAGMYLKYETMHFARGLLLNRLAQEMESGKPL